MNVLVQHAGCDKDRRRSTNGADQPILLMLPLQTANQRPASLEILRSLPASGKDDRVKVVVLDVVEQGVGPHVDAVGAANAWRPVDGRRHDLNAAAPQNVNNRDSLDVFEAVRQWYEDLCHNDQMRFFASLQRILRPIMSLSLSAATAFSASSRTGIWTNP